MSVVAFRARTIILDAASTPVHDAVVVVRDGRVVAVTPWSDARREFDGVIDVAGVLMPGMIDAHSHLRGLPLVMHGISARHFEAWICSLPAATQLDPHDEALVASVGLLETGVTAVQGVVDAGSNEQATLARGRATAAGLSLAGIRGLIVLGFADRAMYAPEPAEGDWALVQPDDPFLPVSEIASVAAAYLAGATPGSELGLGPIGAQWSTDATLEAITKAAGNHRIHTHLNESSRHRHWLAGAASPVDRLDAAGLLTGDLSAAHAVHLLPVELDRIAACGASLVHCPMSNDALRVGTAQVSEWLSRGIPTALGIDSQNEAEADMFAVMRHAVEVSRRVGDPLTHAEVFAMATTGGARALGLTGGGRIIAGSFADLVEMNIDVEPSTAIDELVAMATPASVESVWVGGEQRVRHGSGSAASGPARQRLLTHLEVDRPAREARLREQSSVVELVERLIAGMPA